MPFINIEKEKRTSVLDKKIDALNYLGLANDRTRLISFGVSLGIDSPTALKVKNSLSRENYITDNDELYTMLVCAAVYHMDGKDINDVLTKDYIFNNADECLNGGLDVIEDNIDNLPKQDYQLRLIEDLDLLYKNIVD